MNYKSNLTYSKVRAVNYAFNYAQTPNPAFKYIPVYEDNGGDCTNFTSQCMLAGGAPMIFSGKNPWWYKSSRWSFSWSVAEELYLYLKNNEKNNLYGIKGKEVPYINMLEPGDVIFYENNNGRISHSATITYLYNDYPLISQHTPNFLNIPFEKNWAAKMHFIQISL